MRLLDRLGALAGLAAVLLMTAALFLKDPSNDLGLSTGVAAAYVGFVSVVLTVWPDGQRVRATRPSSQTGPSDS